MKKMRVSERDFIRLFLLMSIVPTGIWLHLDLLRFGVLPLFISLIVLEFAPHSWWKDELTENPPLVAPSYSNVAIGLLTLLPAISYMILTWKQEDPIGGDFSYQFSVSRAFMGFFMRWGWLKLGGAFLGVVGLCFGLRRLGYIPRFAFLGLFLLLYLASFKLSYATDMLGRYPDFFYFLAVPLNILSSVFHWDSPMNANRLTNFFGFCIWLWFLRPVFIRRWPDLQVLPFALYFLWQKQIVWYGTTTYLEPWAILFIVMAFESLISLPLHRKWTSLIWIGFSSITKEPGIILLPCFSVALLWFYWRESHHRKVAFRHWVEVIGVSFFSGTGFLNFYIFKKTVGGLRVYNLRPLQQLFSWEPWRELAVQQHFQFGTSGLILCTLIVFIAMAVFFRSNKSSSNRGLICLCLGCAVFILGFFLVDAAAEWFVGYSRYNLYVITVLGVVLFPISRELIQQRWKKAYFGLILSCGLLNFAMLGPLLISTRLPGDVMNNMEFYGMPCYFPIQKLVGAYLDETKPELPPVVGLMGFRSELTPTLNEYPNLMARIRPQIEHGNVDNVICRCSSDTPALFAGFEPASQLALVDSTSGFAKAHAEFQLKMDLAAKECVGQLQQTCKRVLLETASNGAVWGALGFN